MTGHQEGSGSLQALSRRPPARGPADRRMQAPYPAWRGRGLAICAGLVAALTLAWAPVQAGEDSPTTLAAIGQALASVRSFQIVTVGKSTERQPSLERIVTTGVRRAGVLWLDVVTSVRPSGAGDTTIDEMVVHGSHVCERGAFNAPLPLTSAFKCRTDKIASASYMQSADPSKALAAHKQFRYVRSAGKSVGNQRCDAYAFTQQSAFMKSRGTLYVSPTTRLPCKEVVQIIQPPLMAAPNATSQRITLNVDATWGHYNDRSLRIPATPAR